MAIEKNTGFRVAIIGGGIGGLTASLFLHHACGAGVSVDVFEQAREFKEIGNGLGLGLNAMRLLNKIGVGRACEAITGRMNDIWFTFCQGDSGEVITTVRSPAAEDTKPVAMARSEFLDVLLGFVKSRSAATLHTNKKCIEIKDLGNAVRISFADGTTAEADLVLGCDGIHSTIRRQFHQDDAVYSGKIAYRGVVPTSSLPDNWRFDTYSIIWVSRDKHFLIFPISRDKSLNIVAFVTKSEDEIQDLKESWSSTCQKRELEEDFADCEETVQQIISLMPEQPSKWRINDRDPAGQWTFMGGKVALLGDAAHPMTPHQGAGAGQAVEDGYVLSRALSEFLEARDSGRAGADLSRYLELYQNVRSPRAQQVQITSREAGKLYELQTPELKDKPYAECLPLMAESLQERMKWIWSEEIDEAYRKVTAGLI